MSKPPLVSVIIPTYNEEADIASTLDALVALDYPAKEILVVDASSDRTPEIVCEYADRGVHLLPQTRDAGRGGARNQGLLDAQGEIVVCLNADVHLPADFLQEIVPHYEAGADFVLVESEVSNVEYLFPRYTQAQHQFLHGSDDPVVEYYWTEGFSCRRDAALAVGGFPETVPMIVAGGDAVFSERLVAQEYKHVFDRSIVVKHTVLARLKDYWRNRVGRGRGGPQRLVMVEDASLARLALSFAFTSLLALLEIGLIVPLFVRAAKLIHHSPRRRADLIPFAFCHALDLLAWRMGNWVGWFEVARVPPEKRQYALWPAPALSPR
jgi:glycosyltransferase involved in cell wall biosynthesis